MTKTRSQTKPACKHTKKPMPNGKAQMPTGKAQKPKGRKTSGNTVVQTTPNVVSIFAPYVPPKFAVQRAIGSIDKNEIFSNVLNIIEAELPELETMTGYLINSVDIIYQPFKNVLYSEFKTNGFPVCKISIDFDCNTVEVTIDSRTSPENKFYTLYYKMYLFIQRLGFEPKADYDDRIAKAKADAYRAEKARYDHNSCGCFIPETLVQMSDLTYRRIDELKSGDTLIGPKGKKQIVKYILKTRYAGAMFSYNGLVGTSNHPIYVGGKWMPMKNVPGAVEIKDYSGFVYTFSVNYEDNTYATSFVANGQECAALGHGYTDEYCDSITHGALASTFWGKRILQIFESKVGQELVDSNGVLTLDDNYELIRDPVTGWVTDLSLIVK
jgi:hypothetical protein